MPHSVQRSTDTDRTFDLTKPDRPSSAHSDRTMKRYSRPSSGAYGLAVTSGALDEERAKVLAPQQQEQERVDLRKLRRRSTPGTAGDYAAAVEEGGADRGSFLPHANAPVTDDFHDHSYADAAKRRGQFFDESHQYRDHAAKQVKGRAQKQSPVLAELKTNVIIKDEFTLVTDLSYQLALRYARPDSCIMIKIDHSACLAMGGTFDPCYLLTINAVPSQMSPSTNKRNAALIQAFMADILSVPAERGIVRFMPIPEENLATGGTTLPGSTPKAEKPEPITIKKGPNEAAKKTTVVQKAHPRSETQVNGNHPVLAPAVQKQDSRDSTGSSGSSSSERPKTSHGPSNAVNGLRMNPISPTELTFDKSPLPNGRPRSIGAPERASAPNLAGVEPIPNVAKQATSKPSTQFRAPRAEVPPPKARNMPTEMKKTSQSSLAPRPVQVPANTHKSTAVTPFTATATTTKISGPPAPAVEREKRNKAVYLDMVTAVAPKSDVSVKSEELDSTRSDSGDGAAVPENITKPRSATLTSKPAMPPPPPKDKEETKSMNSRLSKRKSFIKLFKRDSSVPPWYKQ